MSEMRSQRPDWVRAINEGAHPPITQEAALPFERDLLLGEALSRRGLAAKRGYAHFAAAAFEAEPFVDAVDRVARALEGEAELNTVGRWMTRRFLGRLLDVRLQLMAYLREDPGVREEVIRQPIFIAGAPRTGTTILHSLLAADPRHRVPLGWELLRPLPPSEDENAEDPRIGLADRELVLPQTVVSGLLAIHSYGARRPKECLSAMSFAFLSEEFCARYHVPSYERWLADADMQPAYDMHKLVLQILQRRRGTSAWVLKSPVHLHSLPTLFATYPDARVAITHRDPLVMLASLTSLIRNLRYAHSDQVDDAAIAAAHLRRYQRSFEALSRWLRNDDIPKTSVHHSRFADFQRDAFALVAELYEGLGRSLDGDAERALRAAIARNEGSERAEHSYSLDAFGGDLNSLRGAFSEYQAHFAVPNEI